MNWLITSVYFWIVILLSLQLYAVIFGDIFRKQLPRHVNSQIRLRMVLQVSYWARRWLMSYDNASSTILMGSKRVDDGGMIPRSSTCILPSDMKSFLFRLYTYIEIILCHAAITIFEHVRYMLADYGMRHVPMCKSVTKRREPPCSEKKAYSDAIYCENRLRYRTTYESFK